MSESLTETTSKTWLGRLGAAARGAVAGVALVVSAIALLAWNESRSIATAISLAEGASLARPMDPSGELAAFDGALVHVSGVLMPRGTAADDVFAGIAAPEGATELVRSVEMLQWRETVRSDTRVKLGGGEETARTYSYEKAWSETPVDSSAFHQPAGHANPPMPYRGASFPVASATLGRVVLDGSTFAGLGTSSPIEPSDETVLQVRRTVGYDKLVLRESGRLIIRPFGGINAVGSLRLGFAARDVETVSAVGKLVNGRLAAYRTSNGRDILIVREGRHAADAMFDDAKSGNATLTWILRLGGFLLMLLGLRGVLTIVGVAGDVLPGLGSVLRFATGLVAFAVAAIGSALVIGVSWLWVRPVTGMVVIGAGAAVFAIAALLARRRAERSGSGGALGEGAAMAAVVDRGP